jgi:hypothetical protein
MMKMQFYFCRGAACLRPQTVKTGKGRITIRPCKKTHRNYAWLILTGLGIVFFMSVRVNATVIQAASCSQQDVQAAINLAQDGDTVRVPAGECTWSQVVSLKGKGISLIAAGTALTIIRHDTVVNPGSFLTNIGVAGKPFRISGFKFYRNTGSFIGVGGSADGWRIDHCEFVSTAFIVAVSVSSLSHGVIDSCTFRNNRMLIFYGNGHDAWKQPSSLGTDNAVYVEDCLFDSTIFTNAIDANCGGRYVFRYNEVVNTYCESHSLQHKFPDGTFNRGTMSWEIYHNSFIARDNGATHTNYLPLRMRGGTGIAFNNTVVNEGGEPFNGFCAIDNRRSYEDLGGVLGRCDGTHPLDGNEDTTGYPCLDQIGRSTDHGSGTDRLPQQLDPVYAWGNLFDGAPGNVIVSNGCDDHIKPGRDFFDHTVRPGYQPYTYPHPLRVSGPVADNDTQTIFLATGWNWISFNVLPADLSLNSVFASILGQVEQVKAQTQSAIRSNGAWKGDLADMSGIGQYKMYKVKVSAACTLTVIGTAVLSATPILLAGGWNWVAYLPTTAISITTALDSIKGQVLQVKSFTQSATYNGTSWSSTFDMQPGQGYAIKMSAPGTLIYPGGK